MIKSIQEFIDGQQIPSGPISTQVLKSANSIENERQAGIKAATPATIPAPAPTPTPPPATKPANTNITTNTTTSNVKVTANTVTKTTVTNVTNTSSGSKTVVTAPQKPVANTADVQTVTTVSDLPIKIVTDPITVDVPTFDRRGNVTGNTQVTLKLDPVTIDDEPIAVSNLDPGELGSALVNSDELDAIAAQAGADGAAAIAAAEEELRVAAADQDQFVFQGRKDWRVRLSLSDAPEVNYLYRAPNPGILNPLNATNGVLFPYTPTISVNYTASYNPTELVHSNYKVFQYSSSSIDSITLSCDFTAQSTYEADYLLAVIHFFRSATKMFYGQDENPRRGTPPPLCYIYGMGSYQFAGQPLAISQFSYNLPNNVDYIKTSSTSTTASTSTQLPRLAGTGAAKGGVLPPANFAPLQEPDTISWVPSKIQLQITCVPMLSRNAVSNKFSLEQYATGALLNGIGKPGGGFW
jgi:hypothetical protein